MQVGGKQRGRGSPTHKSTEESGGTRAGPRLTSSAQTVRNSKRGGGGHQQICKKLSSFQVLFAGFLLVSKHTSCKYMKVDKQRKKITDFPIITYLGLGFAVFACLFSFLGMDRLFDEMTNI